MNQTENFMASGCCKVKTVKSHLRDPNSNSMILVSFERLFLSME